MVIGDSEYIMIAQDKVGCLTAIGVREIFSRGGLEIICQKN